MNGRLCEPLEGGEKRFALTLIQRGEVGGIRGLNVPRGQICQLDSANSRCQRYRSPIFRVRFPANIALRFECPEYLRGHHYVEFRVLRKVALAHRLGAIHPRQRREKHILDVRQVVRGESCANVPLPGVGCSPQREPHTRLRVGMPSI